MPAANQSAPEVIKSPGGEGDARLEARAQSGRRPGMLARLPAIAAALAPYARSHRRLFLVGGFFTVVLVAVRVAMPWPLQLLIKPWLAEEPVATPNLFGWHPAVVVGIAYAVMIALLGFADYQLRLHFARFAIGVVRDVRAGILKQIANIRRLHPERTTGDFVTRLVGDSARLKAGLKGFLVHVATNGLLFLGISAVLFWIDWSVGLIFFSASGLIILVTLAGASRIFARAIRFRKKESAVADDITTRLAYYDGDDDDDEEFDEEPDSANRASSRHEASLTRLQGLITWAAHLVLAVALPAALWQGYHAVVAGAMDPSELFVVMLYALMIIGPMVRLTRQGARSGKILANADRLKDLLQDAAAPSGGPVIKRLETALVLDEVRINSRASGVKSRRLGPISIEFRAGEKVAVVGGPGTGKSTLLSLLAGWERYKGSARWDGVELREAPYDDLNEQIAYVAQVPHWPAVEADEIADAYRDAPSGDPVASLLDSGRFRALRSRLQKGAGAKIFSENVSHAERKVLALVRYRTSSHSLKLIDDPISEMNSKKAADRLLTAFMSAQGKDQTIVVALNRPAALEQFDRLIVIRKKGRIAFDGTPADWQKWRKADPAAAAANSGGESDHD